MIFLSWNYRGFGSKLKVKALKYLKGMVNHSIILLQETKMEAKSILEETSNLYKNIGEVAVISQGDLVVLQRFGMSKSRTLR
jgi:exonuclease III